MRVVALPVTGLQVSQTCKPVTLVYGRLPVGCDVLINQVGNDFSDGDPIPGCDHL